MIDNTFSVSNLHTQTEYCACDGITISVETHQPVDPEPSESIEEAFERLKHSYCLCEDDIKMFRDLFRCEGLETTHEDIKRTKKKLLLQKHDFESHLEKLHSDLGLIRDLGQKVSRGRVKSSRKYDESFRRSHFIGVSRNGPNWQALICIKKRKTYIGTYETEEEAAKAFDLYSLLLHSTRAKTNYSYTKKKILEKVAEFEQQRRIV